MTMPRLPPAKRGSTFSAYVDYAIGGVSENFPATDLRCQVRTDNFEFLTELTIAAGLTTGRYIISATPVQTGAWPIGDVFFDIKRTSGGVTTSTETVVIEILRGVTP